MSVAIAEIIRLLDCTELNRGNKDYVRSVVASGLMSDVLTVEDEEFLLVTGLCTPQAVRTADMVEANAILFTGGKIIPRDTVKLGKELGITLLTTNLPKFEACVLLGKLFPVEPLHEA